MRFFSSISLVLSSGFLLIVAAVNTSLIQTDSRTTTTRRRLDQPGGLDCYSSLTYSDVDVDRQVNKTEFITFLQLYGPDNLLPEGLNEFEALPVIFQSTFNILSCFCQNGIDGDGSCCRGDAGVLGNTGAYPDDTPTEFWRVYLDRICTLTGGSIEQYKEDIGLTPAPTSAPVIGPTREPTLPTRRPTTIMPSQITTVSPTMGPTFTPTESPTMTPTSVPTAVPTAVPTIASSNTPTLTPTVALTPPPSPQPLAEETVFVSYIIAKKGDPPEEDYRPSLIAAMDKLATRIAADSTPATRTRRLRILQAGSVEVQLPTTIEGISNSTCPDTVASTDTCSDVTASISFKAVNSTSTPPSSEALRSSLDDAIADGELQSYLAEVDPDSPVYIVDEVEDGSRVVPEENERIGGGPIAIIVLVGMALILIMLLVARRRNQRTDCENDAEEDYQMKDRLNLEEMEDLDALASPQTSNFPTKETFVAAGAAGAVMTSSDRRERQDSDAGSSGWSSREGMSSVDEDSRASTSAGTGLADPEHDENSSYSGSSLHLTYSELDNAIQKGDWAAVGVTAALLASQSHGDAAEKKVNFQGDMNPDRAAELDRLVEAGDWAGVVAAAAKYDAQETSQSAPLDASDANTSSAMSVASTRTGGDSVFSGSGTAVTGASGFYTSTGTTNSDSGSRGRKLEEIRAEVEMLVERVVPEEKDNIDEMMVQFRGREEELVETLRSMQEREVAMKARLEGQKRAKRDARQTAEQKKLATVAAAVEESDTTWMNEIETTPAEPEVHMIDTSDNEKPPMYREETDVFEDHTDSEVPDEDLADVIAAANIYPEEIDPSPSVEVVALASVATASVASVAAATIVSDAETAKEISVASSEDLTMSFESTGHPPPRVRSSKPRTMEELQEALKRAIDAEDWEKVAETAAGLSGKFNYDSDDEGAYAGSTASTADRSHSASTKSTDKSQKINELVDKGDWDAVVAVASQFAEDDIRSASTADDSRDIEERRARRQQRLKEEQEALEQADIWSAIADQTRQSTLDYAESEANRAATVAADWAIARSLSELQAADKAGQLSEQESDSDSSSGSDSNEGV